MSDLSRRGFVSAVAVAGMVPAMSIGAETASLNGLVHVAYFWLNNPGPGADRDMLVQGLKTLAAVPSIRALHVGVPASTEQRDVVDNSFDVAEIMVFDDVEGQNSYQSHPLHQAFVEQHSHLWRTVVVHDSVMS